MNDKTKKIVQFLNDIGSSTLQQIRGVANQHDQEILDYKQEELNAERLNNIALASVAMRDAGLNDGKIIEMLQKHWDLRRSEAEDFIRWAHKQIPDKEC